MGLGSIWRNLGSRRGGNHSSNNGISTFFHCISRPISSHGLGCGCSNQSFACDGGNGWFEGGLKAIATSLTKKGGIKRYEKVLERIGRLKEKYAPIGRYYRIEVKQADGTVTEIQWDYEKQKAAEERFSGSYFLRTSRLDLGEQEIWSLHAMLTRVEDAFRSLKNELNLRPIYHQKERRSDGHLFITVLAYHLLNSIQAKLYKKGIQMRWSSIRTFLSSHALVTTSMTNIDSKRIHIRDCSELEPFHRQIYNALGLRDKPLKAKRVRH